MNNSLLQLPSNQRFGYFFTIVFLIAAVYSYYINNNFWLFTLSGICIALLITTILKAEILMPLNKCWFRFGLILGMVFRPIIMGIIFFGIFTPIAILIRLFGRDELNIKFLKKSSYWIRREASIQDDFFNHQF